MENMLISIIFLAVGILFMLKPDLIWRIEHFWDTEGGHPSDMFIRYIKLVGGIAIIIGAVLLFTTLF